MVFLDCDQVNQDQNVFIDRAFKARLLVTHYKGICLVCYYEMEKVAFLIYGFIIAYSLSCTDMVRQLEQHEEDPVLSCAVWDHQ